MPMPLITHQPQQHEQLPREEAVKIVTLLQINPDTLTQHQKFTTEGMIIKIDQDMRGYMNRCKCCNRKIKHQRRHWHCQQPGTTITPNYSHPAGWSLVSRCGSANGYSFCFQTES